MIPKRHYGPPLVATLIALFDKDGVGPRAELQYLVSAWATWCSRRTADRRAEMP